MMDVSTYVFLSRHDNLFIYLWLIYNFLNPQTGQQITFIFPTVKNVNCNQQSFIFVGYSFRRTTIFSTYGSHDYGHVDLSNFRSIIPQSSHRFTHNTMLDDLLETPEVHSGSTHYLNKSESRYVITLRLCDNRK